MPKAARISDFVPASTDAPTTTNLPEKPDHALVSIALFSALGLLASLVAIIFGVPGEWY
jgi:hypothetical protein